MSDEKAWFQLQFESYQIRRRLNEETGEWRYAVGDIIEALTNRVKPRDYWYRMKKRVAKIEGLELSTICRQFKLKASNNRFYREDMGSSLLIRRNVPLLGMPSC
jgi:hypothetical protein